MTAPTPSCRPSSSSFRQLVVRAVLLTLPATWLSACGKPPSDTPAPALDPAVEVAQMMREPVQDVLPQHVGEVFALGSAHTDLQREELKHRLIGGVVQWRLQVYEVSQVDGGYRLVSQPLSTTHGEGVVNLLRATVLIQPRNEKDHETVRRLKTGDTVLVRGRVQDIVIRVTAAIAPAVVMDQQEQSH